MQLFWFAKQFYCNCDHCMISCNSTHKKSESYSSITVFANFPQLEDLEHLILWDSTNCLFLLEFGSLGEVAVLFPQGGKSSICIVCCPLTSFELHAVFLRTGINTYLLTITLLKPCV